MDLLGSILNKMDAPPVSTINKEQSKKLKEIKEKDIKAKEEQKQLKLKFRDKTEKEINSFINDPEKQKLKYHSLDKVQRSIVHDIAEVAGLTSFSFGEEEIDRYIILWKKEFAPGDVELEAYRNGENFDDPSVAARLLEASIHATSKDEEQEESSKVKRNDKQSSNYFDKYKRIIGDNSGLAAATATGVNASYGVVPSKNKQDQRSIEETLNELSARKKRKIEEEEKLDT